MGTGRARGTVAELPPPGIFTVTEEEPDATTPAPVKFIDVAAVVIVLPSSYIIKGLPEPEVPEVPELPLVPDDPEVPELPDVPLVPLVPDVPLDPEILEPDVPEVPDIA